MHRAELAGAAYDAWRVWVARGRFVDGGLGHASVARGRFVDGGLGHASVARGGSGGDGILTKFENVSAENVALTLAMDEPCRQVAVEKRPRSSGTWQEYGV